MILSKKAWNKMVKLVENPPEPTPAMRALMEARVNMTLKAMDVASTSPISAPKECRRTKRRTDAAVVAEALDWLRTPGVS